MILIGNELLHIVTLFAMNIFHYSFFSFRFLLGLHFLLYKHFAIGIFYNWKLCVSDNQNKDCESVFETDFSPPPSLIWQHMSVNDKGAPTKPNGFFGATTPQPKGLFFIKNTPTHQRKPQPKMEAKTQNGNPKWKPKWKRKWKTNPKRKPQPYVEAPTEKVVLGRWVGASQPNPTEKSVFCPNAPTEIYNPALTPTQPFIVV